MTERGLRVRFFFIKFRNPVLTFTAYSVIIKLKKYEKRKN